jgi:hypothetical protein
MPIEAFVRLLAFFVVILAPSAWLAWSWRAMPHLGYYHDDSLYWVCAKSIAEGKGYRIQSLPDQPWQTKYPPLFPLLLSIAWRWGPTFPANLPLATLLVWCLFPLYVWLVWLYLEGFRARERLVLTAAAALNPVAVLFSLSLMSELLFVCLLLGMILVPARYSGLLAGLAFLTRTAALPAIVIYPICLALRKRYRDALIFLASSLPFVFGWETWVATHLSPSRDPVTLYYTNYIGYNTANVGWHDLPLVIWHNLDGLLTGIAKLLTFDIAIFESRHIEWVIAVAAIAGIVRLTRRARRFEYPMIGVGLALTLLPWAFQPDQRFVFPLYPLLLAGLYTELKNIISNLDVKWHRYHPFVLAPVLACSLYGLFVFLPALLSTYTEDFSSRMPVYRWLARSIPETAGVFAFADPVAYLYTGRHACSRPVVTSLIYHEDRAGIDKLVDQTPAFAHEHGLNYLLLTPSDFHLAYPDHAQRLLNAAARDPGWRLCYSRGPVFVYSAVKLE